MRTQVVQMSKLKNANSVIGPRALQHCSLTPMNIDARKASRAAMKPRAKQRIFKEFFFSQPCLCGICYQPQNSLMTREKINFLWGPKLFQLWCWNPLMRCHKSIFDIWVALSCDHTKERDFLIVISFSSLWREKGKSIDFPKKNTDQSWSDHSVWKPKKVSNILWKSFKKS